MALDRKLEPKTMLANELWTRRSLSWTQYLAHTHDRIKVGQTLPTIVMPKKVRRADQSWTWVGSIHGSGRRVKIFSLVSGVGRVGSLCVCLCGSSWITQNVTLSVMVKFTQFSELPVLLKLISV